MVHKNLHEAKNRKTALKRMHIANQAPNSHKLNAFGTKHTLKHNLVNLISHIFFFFFLNKVII